MTRASDAGFFADWSEWAGWIFPEPERARFIVHVSTATGADMVSKIPGATAQKRDRLDVSNIGWIVPAASWQHLREAAPVIAAAGRDKIARQRAAAQRLDEVNREQWAQHKADLAALKPSVRELCERIDEIADAILRGRVTLTAWEHDFVVPIIDRLWRHGPALRMSDKQRAVIDRIYAKVGKRTASS